MRSFADEKTGNAGITFNKTPKSLANRKRKNFLFATDCTGHYSNIHLCKSNIQSRMPEGNIDMGSTIGSYAGLMLLIVRILLSEFSRQPYPIIKSWLLSSVFLCFFSILI
jgi:hypothetical protein